MAQEETEPKPKGKRLIFLKIVSGIMILLMLCVLAVYIMFNFFGTRLLREFVQRKIEATSQGLYSVDFSELKINIFTRKVSLKGFSLSPDTALYAKMKEEGRPVKNLYRINYREMILYRINFYELYTHRNLLLREMKIVWPEIVLMGYADTLSKKKGRFKNIYEDVYPLASKIFKDIQIDSVVVEHARIISDREGKPGKESFGEYAFSAVLRDVSVNPFSYYNKNRVFYSRDIDFRVYNVNYSLTDSLYFLQAGELGFNLLRSSLYGKNISLRPNFFSKRLSHSWQGTFFQIDLPELNVTGLNLYEALTEEKVNLRRILLERARIKVFRNESEEADSARHARKKGKARRPLNRADLYSVIAGKLKSVHLDSLSVSNVSFEYFSHIYDNNPELRVGRMDLGVRDFDLDSATSGMRNRIFHSRDIDISLNEISLLLRDGIHMLDASRVYLSTRKKVLEIEEGMLYPNKIKNLQDSGKTRNTIFVLLPSLTFGNLDILKAFYKRDLIFSNLTIHTPDIHYTKYRPGVKKTRRFSKARDFFEESNENAVYDLLKKYVNTIKGDSIVIDHGYLAFQHHSDSSERVIASGTFGLRMYDFLIDSVRGMNRQGYFYSRDFDFTLNSCSFFSQDSTRKIILDELRIVTRDSLIKARGISYSQQPDSAKSGSEKTSTAFTFTLERLLVQGLDHKKLFLEKSLRANRVRIENPRISVKSWDPLKSDVRTAEVKKASGDFISDLSIGELQILKGDISFDGLELKKSSYFKLKGIDFAVDELAMSIPKKGIRKGSIRFDSVRLSVHPLRMIVMDSAYEISCADITLRNYPLDIAAQGVSITPLDSQYLTGTGKPVVSAFIPRLKIDDFYFDQAIFNGRWKARSLTLPGLRASVSLPPEKEKRKAGKKALIRLSVKKGDIQLDSLLVAGAALIIKTSGKKGREDFPVLDLNLKVTGFRVDSLKNEDLPGSPFFNARDISVSARGREFVLKDSLYSIAFRSFSASTAGKYLKLDSVSLHPLCSREVFYRKTGFQTDIFTFSIPGAELTGVDFSKVITGPALKASVLKLKDLYLYVYRDKRIRPLKPGKKGLLQSVIRGIGFPVTIDTVIASNAAVRYEEQVADEPGHIFFERMNVTANNVSNDSSRLKNNRFMKATGTTYFMGHGLMKGDFTFDMMHPRDSLWWSGSVDTLDLRLLNPMLTRLLPASISHGMLSRVKIPLVAANDHTAVGSITLHYKDLYILLNPSRKGAFYRLENELLTDAANAFIPDQNPALSGRTRRGIIYFERDTTKAIFNYLWKSSLSGIKSSVGINTAHQKQIKKETKRKGR